VTTRVVLEQKRFIQQARLDRDHNKQAMSNAAAFLFCAELFRALNLMIVILSGGRSLHWALHRDESSLRVVI